MKEEILKNIPEEAEQARGLAQNSQPDELPPPAGSPQPPPQQLYELPPETPADTEKISEGGETAEMPDNGHVTEHGEHADETSDIQQTDSGNDEVKDKEEGEEKSGEKKKVFGKNPLRSVKIDTAEIKDMFFGDKVNAKSSQETEEDDEETPVFGRRKRKPMTADPTKDKLIFSVEYMLTPDQAVEGYTLFYNEFVKKYNIKFTALLGAAAAVFLLLALISSTGYLNYLMMIICLSLIAMKWLNTFSAGKEASESADDVKNDSYKLSFYNSRILIEASQLAGDRIYNYPPVMIRFEDIDLKVIDCDGLYVLIFRKNYIYTVPQSALSERMRGIFKDHLMNILGDDYHELELVGTKNNDDSDNAKKEKTKDSDSN